MPYKILILGASYGSLLATKLALAGHSAKMICLPNEAELFNKEGAIVRMPVKGREGLVRGRVAQAPRQDHRRRPGRRQAAANTTWSCSACRSRSTARPACASCSTPSRSRRCRACRS